MLSMLACVILKLMSNQNRLNNYLTRLFELVFTFNLAS